jgi:putative Mn2+ efflux pump MntP
LWLPVIAIALALGWDSLAAGLGLGTIEQARSRALKFAIVFGVSDGIASFVGMAFGHALSPALRSLVEIIGPVLIALTGLVVLLVPDLAQRCFSWNRWALMGVPLAFTLDNLNVGLGRGLDLGRFPLLLEVALIGLVSGLMAWIGITLAMRAQRLLPEFSSRAAGLVLVAVAVHQYVT